jgi:N-acetylmuramoyl-L-alanine amidase
VNAAPPAPGADPLPVAAPAVPALDILAPRGDALRSTRAVVHLLGSTQAGHTVRVDGVAVEVFASGVFARDGLALVPGSNRFVVEAQAPGGATTTQVLTVERVLPPAGPVWPADAGWLDGGSLQPADTVRLAPGEAVEVSLRATPGRRVQAALPGEAWHPLAEVAPGRYRALLRFAAAPGTAEVAPAPVRVRLLPPPAPLLRRPARSARPERPLLALTPGSVGQWPPDAARLFVVGADGVEPTFGLHEVRLGGPSLGELPAGTLLQASGERGAHLRLALAPDAAVWAPRAALAPAAAGTRPPQLAFGSLSVSGDADGGFDVIRVPLAAPVPYAVRARRDAAGRHALEIEVYGAHHASTWISHRHQPQLVEELSAEQAGPGRVRLTAWLRSARLWGWRVMPAAGALELRVMPAPAIDPAAPLRGLRIALEAGHGGPTNLGAVGATGTPEKDFNRWTTDALAEALRAAGAEPIDIRPGDDNPTLRERVRRAEAAAAQLYVSVHANATDTAAGYLRVSGASTFYKHLPSQPLAAAVHRRVLAATGLPDFGLVGNFNYAPLRLLTSMPAVLVEQAFVSHPGDEARLLDPAFRTALAQAVRLGIEDALRG